MGDTTGYTTGYTAGYITGYITGHDQPETMWGWTHPVNVSDISLTVNLIKHVIEAHPEGNINAASYPDVLVWTRDLWSHDTSMAKKTQTKTRRVSMCIGTCVIYYNED